MPLKLGEEERAWIGKGSNGFPVMQKGKDESLVLNDPTRQIKKYVVVVSRDGARQDLTCVLSSVSSEKVVAQIARWL